MRPIISILLDLYVYNRNFALHYSQRSEAIGFVKTDRTSILMIRVKVDSKPGLVEDRERNSALYVVVTRSLLRDGGMAEDHEAPEAEQLSRVWTRELLRASGAKSP